MERTFWNRKHVEHDGIQIDWNIFFCISHHSTFYFSLLVFSNTKRTIPTPLQIYHQLIQHKLDSNPHLAFFTPSLNVLKPRTTDQERYSKPCWSCFLAYIWRSYQYYYVTGVNPTNSKPQEIQFTQCRVLIYWLVASTLNLHLINSP